MFAGIRQLGITLERKAGLTEYRTGALVSGLLSPDYSNLHVKRCGVYIE